MTNEPAKSAYTGTLEGAIAAFFEHANLAITPTENTRRDYRFERAMEQLVLIGHYQAIQGGMSAESLAEFRRASAPLLATPPHLDAYILRTKFHAEGANEDEWYVLSMRRSAIQLAIDDYPGPPVADEISAEDVEALDQELKELGKHDEQGPIDPAYIPRGLPDSHWWWHYPEQFK